MAFGKPRVIKLPTAKYLTQRPVHDPLDAVAVVRGYLLALPGTHRRGTSLVMEGWVEADVKNPMSFEVYKLFSATICSNHSVAYMRNAHVGEGFRHFDSKIEGNDTTLASYERSVRHRLDEVFHLEPIQTHPWHWAFRCYTETLLVREMNQAVRELQGLEDWRATLGELRTVMKGIRRR